ncbi:condensation domain-containing protein [Streptomyces sp. NPDC014734]|uniref:condensation domain-containing protein n=1 Tax=Streptomyces sp. NPDC014734 TaxID=3364886 RepID=UPI0036F9675B
MSHKDIEDVLPVTPLQEGLYFEWLHRGDEKNSYVLQDTLDLRGVLDVDRLRAALAAVFARHPALRTGFLARPTTGELVQVVLRSVDAPLTTVDLGGLEGTRRTADLESLLAGEILRERDLSRPPLLQCVLIRLDTEHHVLALTYHHILLDGWSGLMLIEQIIDGYDTHAVPSTSHAANPYHAYGDWVAGQDRALAENAWRDYLADLGAYTRVAPEGARNTAAVSRRVTCCLDRGAALGLRAYARAGDLTLNTVVQAAWGLLLGRLCASDDIVIGRTVAGRPAGLPHSEQMMGMFVNTVPARIRPEPGETLQQLCHRLQFEQSRLMGYEYVGLPAIQRISGRRALFDTAFSFQNLPAVKRELNTRDGRLRITLDGHNISHYPLALTVFPDRERLTMRLTYAGDVFDDTTMRSLTTALPLLLTRMAEEPRTRISEVGALRVTPLPRPRSAPIADGHADGTEVPEAGMTDALVGLLADVLDVPKESLGPHDDFFDLGGGSLQAARLVILIQRTLGIDVSVRHVLDHPVIGDMAGACARAGAAPR